MHLKSHYTRPAVPSVYHQLPLNGNFRAEEREKQTHLKLKPNKNCLVCTTQPKDDSSLAGLFRETRGGGDHTRAHQPLRPWPAASAYGFLASEKSKHSLDLSQLRGISLISVPGYVLISLQPKRGQMMGGAMNQTRLVAYHSSPPPHCRIGNVRPRQSPPCPPVPCGAVQVSGLSGLQELNAYANGPIAWRAKQVPRPGYG